jgi:poly(3-hydroxybutyrate) depolymerase
VPCEGLRIVLLAPLYNHSDLEPEPGFSMLSKTLTFFSLALAAATGVLATQSAGCGKTPSLRSGMQSNINVAGQSRQWILRIPSNYNNTHPYRLIFGLHWLNGHYTDVDSGGFYGLQPLSNNSAIFIAPDGLNTGWANTNGNDITFIGNLMTLVENDLCVDQSLRFSTGWSYGGAMSCKSTKPVTVFLIQLPLHIPSF